jgi:hypothetical protein
MKLNELFAKCLGRDAIADANRAVDPTSTRSTEPSRRQGGATVQQRMPADAAAESHPRDEALPDVVAEFLL